MVILLLVATTLLLLRNNCIYLYQSLNFVLFLSNHPRSGTMLFGVIVYIFLLYIASTGAVNISSISNIASSVLLFDTLFLVILSDFSISSSTSIVSGLYPAILFVYGFYHNCLFLLGTFSLFPFCGFLLYMFRLTGNFVLFCL